MKLYENKKYEKKKGHKNITFKSACISIRFRIEFRKLKQIELKSFSWHFHISFARVIQWFNQQLAVSQDDLLFWLLFASFGFKCYVHAMPSAFESFLILARAIWINDVIVGALKYRFMCSFSYNHSDSTYIVRFSSFFLCCAMGYKRKDFEFQ